MPHRKSTLVEIARWFRFLYFLRFSLFLWLFPLIMVGLNVTGARTITSGILVPEHWAQYACVTFFIVTAGFVALITTRITVINGEDRFDARRPKRLVSFFADDKSRHELAALLTSQLPNLVVFGYIWINSVSEGVPWEEIISGIALGVALAGFMWWVINAAFYLTFTMPPIMEGDPVILGGNAARTILFPRNWFGLTPPGKPATQDTLEGSITPLSGRRFINFLSQITRVFSGLPGTQGYFHSRTRIYEAHVFAIVASLGFFFLYVAAWPMTAPVPVIGLSITFYLILMVLPSLCALWVFWKSRPAEPNHRLLKWQILFTVSISLFVITAGCLYLFTDAERFPVFALILIVVILTSWMLSAVAFVADRYRIPVTATILLLIILPRISGFAHSREEHYISTAPAVEPLNVKTPAELLEKKLKRTHDSPLIIVTATGGGLHASAWTASILSRLETDFQDSSYGGSAPAFHDHLLLLSTVSGGSVGLLPYLSEIQSTPKGAKFNRIRVVNSAQCSSLEAVGWGLVYYDLPRTFIPFIPDKLFHSIGVDDLDHSPLFKDRTWALRKGFARNLNDRYCGTGDLPPNDKEKLTQLGWNERMHEITEQDEKKLTLEHLMATGDDPKAPAFTMNTTTVEGGRRFLLSNYSMPRKPELGAIESFPAESFLDLYSHSTPKGTPAEKQVTPADLPLATAAQLSATFPYVSSAARIPSEVTKDGLHFVDGGYYDNDGTASAVEFLRSALEVREKNWKRENETDKKQGKPKKEMPPPVRIILVEIRNSPDVDNDTVGDAPVASSTPWNVLSQIDAPLLGFWNGGHESVTERNRVGLDLLVSAFPEQLRLQRVVFADANSFAQVHTDPLNWSLTPAQRQEVECSAGIGQAEINGKQTECSVLFPTYKTGFSQLQSWFNQPAAQQPSRPENMSSPH